MKFNYSNPATGKTESKDLGDEGKALLIGKRIGDEIDGSAVGMAEYTFRITGGSDSNGFPLDRSIRSSAKIKTLRMRKGKKDKVATRKKVIVRGNIIAEDTAVVNAVAIKYPNVKEEGKQESKEEKPEGNEA